MEGGRGAVQKRRHGGLAVRKGLALRGKRLKNPDLRPAEVAHHGAEVARFSAEVAHHGVEVARFPAEVAHRGAVVARFSAVVAHRGAEV
ncbi:MAG TPA: hypothetical protein DDZ88_23340, partial [Verrucomicrobiales bacterium]|nr:hypothetical protein [Verrucomicrobiales bacterium]